MKKLIPVKIWKDKRFYKREEWWDFDLIDDETCVDRRMLQVGDGKYCRLYGGVFIHRILPVIGISLLERNFWFWVKPF